MRHLALTMVAFALAAGVNTGSVALQSRTGVMTRRFGARAWYVHLGLTLPAWGAFIFLLVDLGHHVRWPLPAELMGAGVALLLVGIGLWVATFIQLGLERVANGYFFGRGPTEAVEGGVFRWLRNPMYDSYFMVFLGLALFKANAVYLLMAAESYLLFNVIEARVENRPFEHRAARGPA
ncbi:MAG: phosphatidylethanolamine N-methyltransferase family protein [Actinobacteria bacterium]|nr:phosphatidylethanolamine N-methyltransferase family protein [Actinomycetota bacterium]